MEQAKLRFVFWNRSQWKGVDEVEVPIADQAIAIFEERGKVVAGLEKDNGNVAQVPAKKMEYNHVLRLEAAGKTNVTAGGDKENFSDQLLCSQLFHIGKRIQQGVGHRCS